MFNGAYSCAVSGTTVYAGDQTPRVQLLSTANGAFLGKFNHITPASGTSSMLFAGNRSLFAGRYAIARVDQLAADGSMLLASSDGLLARFGPLGIAVLSQPTPALSITPAALAIASTAQPLASASQPLAPAALSIAPAALSIAPAAQPLASTSQPLASAALALASAPEPLASASQPLAPAALAITSAPKPLASASQPLASAALAITSAAVPITSAALSIAATSQLRCQQAGAGSVCRPVIAAASLE
ncbi:hypothetical protein ABPG75_008351 [Micractinium tetrahymenae]